MFEIEKHSIGRFACHRLINRSTGAYLEILNGFGAGINNWVVKNTENNYFPLIDGYRTEEEILNQHHSSYKGSKLSPFSNRIPKGKYSYNEVDYQFSLNEEDINSLHGFLHNQPFDVVAIEENDSSAELILGYHYNGIAKGYPFAYDMRIIYRYDERGFEVITEITNTCGSVMPIGDGWHPYYRFEDIDQIKLKFGRATRIASNFGNGLNAKHGFEELSTIGDLVMDDCFKIEDAGSEYEIQIEDQKRGITLSLWQECDKNRYQYFHIYTPPERKTMAFEPVTSPINSFSTGVSLIELRPLESFTAKFGVGINRRRGHE